MTTPHISRPAQPDPLPGRPLTRQDWSAFHAGLAFDEIDLLSALADFGLPYAQLRSSRELWPTEDDADTCLLALFAKFEAFAREHGLFPDLPAGQDATPTGGDEEAAFRVTWALLRQGAATLRTTPDSTVETQGHHHHHQEQPEPATLHIHDGEHGEHDEQREHGEQSESANHVLQHNVAMLEGPRRSVPPPSEIPSPASADVPTNHRGEVGVAASAKRSFQPMVAPGSRKRPTWWYAIPLVAAAAVAIMFLQPRPPGEITVRGQNDVPVITLAAPLSRPDGVVLLDWTVSPGIEGPFTLQILREFDVVLEQEVVDPPALLTPDVLTFEAGVSYRWVVTPAFGGDAAHGTFVGPPPAP